MALHSVDHDPRAQGGGIGIEGVTARATPKSKVTAASTAMSEAAFGSSWNPLHCRATYCTQCENNRRDRSGCVIYITLGSLGGKEWLIGVAPAGDLGDDARPRVEEIAAFRVPGDRLIKLHVATWHAGPHFVHDECLFFNLENRDTNRRDFHAVPLSVECRYRL